MFGEVCNFTWSESTHIFFSSIEYYKLITIKSADEQFSQNKSC